jgi:signal transduction histidine kinase
MPQEDFYYGLTKSIIFPFAISLPISIFTTKYHKKTLIQKQELEQLNELNNKLISIIAHDIRSPLSIVNGFVEIMHKEVDNENTEKLHTRLDNISGRIDNLLIFLNDLLKWSKNQIHLAPVQMTSFKTVENFTKIIQTFEELQKEKKIITTTNIQVKQLFADKEIYSFILRNIYHNALKFSHKGGSINIDLLEIESEIHTIITDNGVGITEANIAKIRNEKQWFSTIGTDNESGTGLGIKTILQYLKICNGQLVIDSKLNSGTSIKIILPKKSHS